MEIPNKLKIDGEPWKIKKVKNELGSGYEGRTYTHDHEILLNVEAKSIDSTLMHEIIHVIDINRGLKLSEEQVQSLSMGIYAVIVDNKLNFIERVKKLK